MVDPRRREVGACGETEPDGATNEIQTCERGPHVHRGHVNENAAKKKQKKHRYSFKGNDLILIETLDHVKLPLG